LRAFADAMVHHRRRRRRRRRRQFCVELCIGGEEARQREALKSERMLRQVRAKSTY